MFGKVREFMGGINFGRIRKWAEKVLPKYDANVNHDWMQNVLDEHDEM